MMPTLLQMSASSGRMWLETMIVLPMLPQLAGAGRASRCGPADRGRGRLVEQQHLRLVQQHAGQAEPLRHARGRAVGIGVALVAEIDQFEHLVADLAAAAAR